MSIDTNQAVKDTATTILSLLEAKNYELIAPLAKSLLEMPDQNLYLELGKLARELHDLIKNINIGEDEETATDKLRRVISLTESAANRTMDGIDRILPLNQHLQAEATSLLKLLPSNWPSAVDSHQETLSALQTFLGLIPKHCQSIQEELQKILVAQNYQDLSGQAIKQIIAVVNTLQTRLVKLVAIAHDAKRLSRLDLDKNETKDTQAATHDKLSNQDEVDDLLSSLGF